VLDIVLPSVIIFHFFSLSSEKSVVAFFYAPLAFSSCVFFSSAFCTVVRKTWWIIFYLPYPVHYVSDSNEIVTTMHATVNNSFM